MGWKIPRLSRRAFLKTTGYGTAGLTLLSPVGNMVTKAVAESEESEETTYSICNFCSSLCNIQVTTRTKNGDKRIVKLDGNPHSTLNRGKICARGQAGLRQTYDTDRIKTPLIREEGSKRGEWAFRQATWEEAWDYIAKKQQAAEVKPWEWTMVGGWTSCVFYMNWAVPFALANQVPNIVASPMQHCVTTGHLGTDMVTGNFNIHDEVLPDYDNAKYILFVANNASIGAVSTCRMVRFAQGRKNGAKVVALDPRRSETAAKADEWIKTRPGTDLAFMLALMKIMMDEGLYDDLFLKRHTNMPFLVRKDDEGEWQLATDAEGHPLVVAEDTAEIRVLATFTNDNLKDINGVSFLPGLTLSKPVEIDGRAVKTVFEAQLEELAEYTPEWAAEITGVPVETIVRISREFGTTRPAIVDPGWHGARFGNVNMLRRAQALVQALTGGIDTVGGWMNSGELHHKAAHMYEAMAQGHEMGAPLATMAGFGFARMVINVVSNKDNQYFQHGKPGWSWAFSKQEREAGRFNVALPAMTDTGLLESVKGELAYNGEPYRTRAIIINAANPVRHYYPDTYWKEILSNENMELVIAVDVLPSDTTPYADVILPNSTYLERDEPTIYGNGVNQDLALTTRYAAIESLYDTEEMADILLKLTEIISGEPGTQAFIQMVDQLTGIKSGPVLAAFAETKKTHKDKKGRGAFAAACRKASFALTAERIHTTPEHLDQVLREKGVYHEEDKLHIIEHQGMPRKMPVPTGSGRVEFFSALMRELRDGGYRGEHFDVFAKWIAPEYRDGKSVTDPLDEDEFYFTYGKVPTVSHGSTNSNNAVLHGINKFKEDIYKGIWMHPARADKLGISNGDAIQLTNTRSGQQATGRAHITRLVQQDTLFLHSSFGTESKGLSKSGGEGLATNKLVPYAVEPLVAGFKSQEFTIKVARA
ncbi:MAG: molybdopterin-dependent oxidoreductase [Gammaproteobacteria bacterium]